MKRPRDQYHVRLADPLSDSRILTSKMYNQAIQRERLGFSVAELTTISSPLTVTISLLSTIFTCSMSSCLSAMVKGDTAAGTVTLELRDSLAGNAKASGQAKQSSK